MEAPAPVARPPPDPKKQMSQFVTIFMFVLAMFVLFDQGLRTWLGTIVGYVLEPLIGLNGTMPVVTLFLAGMIMTALSVVMRHLFTDYIEQTRSQKIVSAFNKELQKARVENNKYKIKKLTEEQPKILKKSMDMSTGQMKLMPITMLAIIPIFAWLSVWIGGLGADAVVNVPWASNVSLLATNVLPNWILLYSLVSIPSGQIIARALRYLSFRKRLRQIEAQAA
ncbi:MAG: DUF106 domain-containing protein [Methanomassiliicoccus sp.]|nr:DUF106 domain-containing protein [Methanomassiliicoccus sp.]